MTRIPGRRPTRKVAGTIGVSTLALGGLAMPAAAQEPAAEAHCRLDGSVPIYSVSYRDLPPNATFTGFAMGKSESSTAVYQGFTLATDATGAGTTPEVSGDPPPVHIGFAVYRDTNGNFRWDPDVDDTVYRGDGPVSACPQSVTLTPK